MWIMIIKCLPIQNPPLKYSIFWSTPWPSDDGMTSASLKLVLKSIRERDNYTVKPDDYAIYDIQDETFRGRTPNWVGARAIIYESEKIRVFPHEFTAQSNPNLDYFINQEQAYHLVADNVAEEQSVKVVLDGEMKPIYESALLDGANHNQALLTVIGMDITLPDADFPPIGYYVLREEYRELLP